MYEDKVIDDPNLEFVLSLMDTRNKNCMEQVLHTDFEVTDLEVVNNPNVKSVLFPIANEMSLRVVNGSHQVDPFNNTDAEGEPNYHFEHSNIVKVKRGYFICFHPKLWHSGWTTTYNVNYRVHLYVGFNQASLDDYSKKYDDITQLKGGFNLFFPLGEKELESLNGIVKLDCAINAVWKHNLKRKRPNKDSSSGRFLKSKI